MGIMLVLSLLTYPIGLLRQANNMMFVKVLLSTVRPYHTNGVSFFLWVDGAGCYTRNGIGISQELMLILFPKRRQRLHVVVYINCLNWSVKWRSLTTGIQVYCLFFCDVFQGASEGFFFSHSCFFTPYILGLLSVLENTKTNSYSL